ncbi:hypothetical protein LY474_26425 [Myxococcus stipitatus]|uniref:hypothetical protein n=1 Tax=Myxococcus stipitatus TaxID=83455 RepID=UPI001F1D747A|nr:hypothetical protein [Myxococcus stipitatus]MCE9671347.1 hypothetical protein [Myxococcus stipitatus]
MKMLKLWMVASAASLVMGCNGVPDDMGDLDPAETASRELTGCYATCAQGTVTCPSTTTSCSATQNVGVTCDGVFTPCPPTTSTCSPLLPKCIDLNGDSCSVLNEQVPCCIDDPGYSWESVCDCMRFGSTPPYLRYLCLL